MFNENQSWYLNRNIAKYASAVKGTERTEVNQTDAIGAATYTYGQGFADANLKFSINGYMLPTAR